MIGINNSRLKYSFFVCTLFLFFYIPMEVSAQVKLENVSIGSSLWLRSYNTPDERSALVNPPTEEGSLNPTHITSLAAELALNEKFSLLSRVGYGTGKYETTFVVGDLIRKETISQRIIPTSIGINYNIFFSDSLDSEDESSKKISLFVGAGLNRYFIQHSISREVNFGPGGFNDISFVGNNYGAYLHVGVRKPLSDRFDLMADLRYNTGFYHHKVYPDELNGASIRKKISAKGAEFGIRLVYKFNHNQ
ncbi:MULTISPECIES: hypothetical protein [Rhodonellum]|nr:MULTISPECIES: hypothetical protein [Rhodonellum]SDZ40444.1 hypothetical protein SAMN05444412_11331 [Rhodonellum ikkaensis]